ncbi:MAG: hypothetical protein LBF49_03445 [Puniceicoccales bacterium]|nr:hypothetical protein [Puniceicoccales bacterium]
MPDEVNIDYTGYTITQDAIDGVVNPFLDLNKALSEQFYFLEGTYDQVVLAKIYTILNSLSSTTKDKITTAEKALAEAKSTYEEALGVYMPLQEAGAYDSSENNTVATLIGILNTYILDGNGIFPSKDATSCKSAIDVAYNDLLSIVCDLFEEAIASITLTDPSFSGNGDLLALKGQLDTNMIGSLGTTLGNHAGQFNVDTSIGSLLTALNSKVSELGAGNVKTNIDAAVTAINTYNLDKSNANLQAVQTELNVIKSYAEITSITPSVSDVLSAITKKISYDAAVTAINTYNLDKSNANLQAVKTALNVIKSYAEITSITPSVSGVLSAITAIDAINTYNSDKSNANLIAVQTALNVIKNLDTPSAAKSSISAVLGNIDTYFDVKGAIESARTAINTFKTTKNKTNLDAVVAELQGINATSTETSYHNAGLETAINAAITKTSGIRTRLQDLNNAIDSYNVLTSLTGAPAAFQEVKRAFNAFSDEDIQAQFNNSILPGLSDRVDGYEAKIEEIGSFDDFYNNLNNLIALCQKSEIKALLTATEQSTYYASASLKEPLIYANLSTLCGLLSGHLQSTKQSVTKTETDFNAAVKDLSDLSSSFDPNANVNDLLSLCMMASTPKPQPDGTYRVLTGIERTLDSTNGNYTYVLKYGGTTINKATYEASFSKEDAYVHYSLPYLALAIMYEKVAIQQMVLVEQLKQVEIANEAIRTNNTALKFLSWMYDRIYGKSTTKGTQTYDALLLTTGIDMDMFKLNSYLENTAKAGNLDSFGNNSPYYYNGYFVYDYCCYNRDGDKPTAKSQDTENIDVREQATLTMISNKQDSVRIYGDQLSTDSQLMTTKMSQYMQNSNSCISAATQVVKSIGDYLKTITSNVR